MKRYDVAVVVASAALIVAVNVKLAGRNPQAAARTADRGLRRLRLLPRRDRPRRPRDLPLRGRRRGH